MRPSWDEYFLNIAFAVARRTSCSKRAVGAVFVRDNYILTTGYNGAPTGEEHCVHEVALQDEVYDEIRRKYVCAKAIHAELNAIIQAAEQGVSLQGSKLYVTCAPCIHCTRHLKQLNLEDIICPEPLVVR